MYETYGYALSRRNMRLIYDPKPPKGEQVEINPKNVTVMKAGGHKPQQRCHYRGKAHVAGGRTQGSRVMRAIAKATGTAVLNINEADPATGQQNTYVLLSFLGWCKVKGDFVHTPEGRVQFQNF